MLALMAGLMGGFQFPLASGLYFSAAPPLNPLLSEEGTKAPQASAQELATLEYSMDSICLGRAWERWR